MFSIYNHTIRYSDMFVKWGVDKTRNMEHPGTFRNIPEHPGTSKKHDDNYEKKCVKSNVGLAHVTIWSALIGQVALFFFSRAEQLSLKWMKSIEKYMRSLIIDDILSGGRNVSTEYYPGSFRAIGSKVNKVQSKRCYSFKRMEDLLSNGRKSPMLPLGVNRKGWT